MKNDRFKFKIFDRVNNIFLNDYSKLYCISVNGDIMSINKLDGNVTCLSYDNFILMQSTGLVDKNGTEVFEGDIIKDSNNYIFKIYYNQEKCCFMAENKEYFTDMNICAGFIKSKEVIGNIYENKDLIKD